MLYAERLREELIRDKCLEPYGTYVVACSGGADSLALTDALYALSQTMPLMLVVAHVEHHIRGSEAERDAALVECYCAKRNLTFVRLDVDTRSLATKLGLSLEMAARQLRYEALRRIGATYGAKLIITAHHAGDQAETVLLNLIKGTGNKGLRAMRRLSCGIYRPFLKLTHEDLEGYVREQGLSYCHDSTNDDLRYERNWVRQELLPLLASHNPRISEALCRLAHLAAQDEACLEQRAEEFCAQQVEKLASGGYVLDVRELLALPSAISGRVLLRLLNQCKKERYSYDCIESIMALIVAGVSGKYLCLPGAIKAHYAYGKLSLTPQVAKELSPVDNTCYTLQVGTSLTIPKWGTIIVTKGAKEGAGEGEIYSLPAQMVEGDLLLRHRRAGDRFCPKGSGRQKLKKFLIDAKIPQEQRDALWLVADREAVLWVVGVKRGASSLEGEAQEYINIKFIKWRA